MSLGARKIVRVETVKGNADEAVLYWRGLGYKVRLAKRTVRAFNEAVTVFVVVLMGKFGD